MPPDLTRVAGLTSIEQCDYLARLAAEVPAGRAIVEIGVFKARSTIALATGARPGVHVWGIDPWDLPDVPAPWGPDPGGSHRAEFGRASTRRQAQRNIRAAGLASKVTLIRAMSVDAAATWDGPPVGLLHVDGDHHGQAVLDDLTVWTPHLAGGAVVAFDDCAASHPEVARAVDHLTGDDGPLRLREIVCGRLAVCDVRW